MCGCAGERARPWERKAAVRSGGQDKQTGVERRSDKRAKRRCCGPHTSICSVSTAAMDKEHEHVHAEDDDPHVQRFTRQKAELGRDKRARDSKAPVRSSGGRRGRAASSSRAVVLYSVHRRNQETKTGQETGRERERVCVAKRRARARGRRGGQQHTLDMRRRASGSRSRHRGKGSSRSVVLTSVREKAKPRNDEWTKEGRRLSRGR